MPKEAHGVAALFAGFATLYFIAHYSGPYAMVANAQLEWFGTNIVNISFWVTFLLLLLPQSLAVWLAEKRLGTKETWFTPVWNNLDRIFDYLPGKLILVGGTTAVMGVYIGAEDLARGELTHLSVAALERGTPPASGFVDLVDGTVVSDANIQMRDNRSTYHYYPVVVEPPGPPMLYVRARGNDAASMHQPIRGRLDRNGIPGEVESQLKNAGMIGETYWLLLEGTKPELALCAWLVVGGIAAVLIAIVWWRTRYAPLHTIDGRVTRR